MDYVCKECGRRYSTNRYTNGYCSDGCARKAGASGYVVTARGKMLAFAGVAIIVVIGLIGLAVDGIRNAFSSTKIEIVSANCDTQEKYASIVNKALSGVSWTKIEGEEFNTYSRQARDAVKEKNKYTSPVNCVYFVRLPDKVYVYVWFETEDVQRAFVYRIK